VVVWRPARGTRTLAGGLWKTPLQPRGFLPLTAPFCIKDTHLATAAEEYSMKFDEVYEGLTKFWDALSIVVVAHIVLAGILIPTRAVSYSLLPALAALPASPRYTQLKAVLTEFELWKSLPYILLLLLLGYVIAFTKLRNLALQLPWFRFAYSPIGFWRAGKPFDDLRVIATRVPTSGMLVETYSAYALLLVRFRKEYPEYYEENVEWAKRSVRMWMGYYSSFATFVLCCVAALAYVWWGRSANLSARGLMWSLGLLLFACAVARVRAELFTETQSRHELSFVANCLKLQPMSATTSQEEVETKLYTELAVEKLPASVYGEPWILRHIRRLPLTRLRHVGGFPLVSLEVLARSNSAVASRVRAIDSHAHASPVG
jgi:hypothetical protein